jgi:hypothetical protein
MGAPDDSIREELIGAVLGELSLLRRDVGELRTALQQAGDQFKDSSDLAMLRLAARTDQFLADFRDSTAGVLDKARQFGEAREQLLGEIAIRQYDDAHDRSLDAIRQVLREPLARPSLTRGEIALWGTGTALLSAALAVIAAVVLAH